MKYSGHLRGRTEYIFRQSVMGSVGHIAIDGADIELQTMYHEPDSGAIRVLTYCGRNLKYGNYSTIGARNGPIRNACEDCFVQYSPDERNADERRIRYQAEVSQDDLPF